jgi:nucleoside-diphosphate-sugar epimerase
VNTFDAANLYRLALESAPAGTRLHAVAEGSVKFRDIAETIGKKLGLQVKSITAEEAPGYFGHFAHFAQVDNPASSELTRKLLPWKPKHPTLLEDLAGPHYFSL